MTKLEAVYEFVMASLSETLAGDFVDYFSGADFLKFVPDRDIDANMPSRKEIEIDFGGDIYRLSITKKKRRST